MAEERERKPKADIVTRDYSIHMSKRLYGVTFKKRAPRAIREIKAFATKTMKTSWVYFSSVGCGVYLMICCFLYTAMCASTPLWISSCGLRELRTCPPESEFVFPAEETRTRMLRRRWDFLQWFYYTQLVLTSLYLCLQLYTLVSHVEVKDFKGLQTETVEA